MYFNNDAYYQFDYLCIVASFLEFILHIFKIKGVTSFLSEKLSQDPSRNFLDVKGNVELQMKTRQLQSF